MCVECSRNNLLLFIDVELFMAHEYGDLMSVDKLSIVVELIFLYFCVCLVERNQSTGILSNKIVCSISNHPTRRHI